MMKKINLLLFALVLSLGQLLAADVFVTQNGAGAKTGADWDNAKSDLGAVLYEATAGTTVHVGAGTYVPTCNYQGDQNAPDIEKRFKLSGGVTLLGGYPAAGGAEAERDPKTNVTILSGKIDDETTVYTIAFGLLGANDIVVDGFAFRNATGRMSGPDDDYMGDFSGGAGAIIVMGGTTPGASTAAGSGLQLVNCDFDGFTAKWGGAIKLQRPEQENNPKLTLKNSTFNNNVSGQNGGAVLAYSWDMEIIECLFDNNDGGGSGGAIFCDGPGILSASESTFSHGKVRSNGAGICCWTESVPWTTCIIDKCKFIENTGWDGVGIYTNNSADCIVSNSVFDGNTSSGGAGAIRLNGTFVIENNEFKNNNINVAPGGWLDGSEGVIRNCVYVDNIGGAGQEGVIFRAQVNTINVSNCYATGNAGKSICGFAWGATGKMENVSIINNRGTAIAFQGATYTLQNLTISGNESPTNGGVLNGSWEGNSSISVYDCTIAGNKSADGQNAMYVASGTAVIEFDNCIYVQNGDEATDYSGVFGTFSRSYSIWDNVRYGSGRFTPLDEPFTVGTYLAEIGKVSGQYVHLLTGTDNPAVGYGSPTSAGTKDQLGHTRPDAPSIGAVEYIDPAGLNEKETAALKVYPAVTTGSLIVGSPFAVVSTVRIYAVNGSLAYQTQVVAGDNLLNVESLTEGNYIVVLSRDGKSLTSRFIKR